MSSIARVASVILGSLAVLLIVASFIHPTAPVLDEGLVVVTGCSPGGLGFEVVKDIIRQRPASVRVLCTVRKEKDAEALREAFGQERVRSVLLDVTDFPALQKLGEELKREKVIALINNAGISKHTKLEELDYRATFEVNVFGVLEATKALLPALRNAAPGSRIVNIGSMAGTFSRPGTLAYCTSKRALEGATDSMRVELLSEGISVSIVQPGFFRTNMCTNPKVCGAGIDEVSAAVLHAAFAPRPRTRYPVATLGAVSAYVGSKIAALAPDRVLDALVLALSPK